MSTAAHDKTPYYYVPTPSRHPAMAAVGLFFVLLGAGNWMNGITWGKYSLVFGLLWFLVVLFQWFKEAIGESESGKYSRRIDISFRWSMGWFIFSEVMFFGAFLCRAVVAAGALGAQPGKFRKCFVVARIQGALA